MHPYFPEAMHAENKMTPPKIKVLWTWEMVRAAAALYNSGGGLLRMGVNNKGIVERGHSLRDYEADGSLFAKALSDHLDQPPPFEPRETEYGFIEIRFLKGVTTPTFLKKMLLGTTPDKSCAAGTLFVRKIIGGKPSSASATERRDWQTALHLWETNRGVTVQGQIIVNFCLTFNQWNPFHPGGNTEATIHQCYCLADIAGTLERPALREGLVGIIHQMQPINERANFGADQNIRGGEYKQPGLQKIKDLCRTLDLVPPP